MKNLKILSGLNRVFKRTGFKLKKYSPEILAAVGVVGTVAGVVLACKATTKISDILNQTREDADNIRDTLSDESFKDEYTPEDGKKDLTIVYIQTGFKLIKLYAPAAALGILSLSCILGSNNILRKRNVALTAAYAAIHKGFREYRNRVVERFGEETDRELKFNIKAKKFEETVVGEDGKEKKTDVVVSVADPNGYSVYARFFDDGCEAWEKDSNYNLMFLRAQQQYANDLLKRDGFLFLNDVYKMLGIPITKEGQIVGWVYNAKTPVGDNYVDFGIYDIYREKARDFVNGYERAILLDFNVDGNIWKLM